MNNELIFLLHIIAIGTSALIALRLGKSALVSLMSVLWILANLFVVKQVTLFGLCITPTDALTVGSTLSLNLLQEYYGPSAARRSIWISFFCSLLYMVLSSIHLMYIPNAFDNTQQHFSSILQYTPRIVTASFVTYLFVQHLDSFIYSLLKRHWHSKRLILRNYCSLALSQAIDTVMFSLLGLYGIVSHIGYIIFASYAIKLVVILLSGPFLSVSKRLFASTGKEG